MTDTQPVTPCGTCGGSKKRLVPIGGRGGGVEYEEHICPDCQPNNSPKDSDGEVPVVDAAYTLTHEKDFGDQCWVIRKAGDEMPIAFFKDDHWPSADNVCRELNAAFAAGQQRELAHIASLSAAGQKAATPSGETERLLRELRDASEVMMGYYRWVGEPSPEYTRYLEAAKAVDIYLNAPPLSKNGESDAAS